MLGLCAPQRSRRTATTRGLLQDQQKRPRRRLTSAGLIGRVGPPRAMTLTVVWAGIFSAFGRALNSRPRCQLKASTKAKAQRDLSRSERKRLSNMTYIILSRVLHTSEMARGPA